ncbi:MAG TPA: hypothetical protein PKC60_06885 [Hydrogenophaga sp.]|uniref:hypothetical protein n=1 Tax=Hydrogenophaga sp. TaxID=1904254 RepID=UPI002B96B57D|nr:hypothetical protein [Hydrogenophaga sp.]HMN92938.1 hypothetical protein [Hydrogenophaga sp.]HMP09759.1 hypothetical protein [Hydrogenophaga sp.]
MNRPTPAIVTQTAVRPMPRLALLLFCAAYVLPGFLGREPWKVDDLSSFGIMRELALGQGDWWSPGVLGLAPDEPGWLPYWLGAIAIRALPFLDPATASRLPFIGLLGLSLAATWYAIYHLARLPVAQPVAFAFGGEANPRDYARAMADAGLLALIACLGLAQLSHETTPELGRLAFGALLLLAMARLARGGPPWGAVVMALLSLLALLLSGMGWPAVVLYTGWLGVLTLHRAKAKRQDAIWVRRPSSDLLAALLLALVLIALAWQHGWLQAPQAPAAGKDWGSFARLLLWFTWPAWPLVLWTLWRWRHQLSSLHIALPLWAAVAGLLNSAWSDQSDRALLLALPALAVLAAFALPTLRRSAAALIDWFTLLFFSFCALVIWVIWFAMQTGVPSKPAANVAKLAPGFSAEFSPGLFLVAALATVAWLGLVAWRVGRHRQAIWKSLVLPASGATLCWLLLMTLWLPVLDFGRSYGPISRRVALMVPSQACVLVDGLTQSQVAGLQHHGGLDLRLMNTPQTSDCASLIVTPDRQDSLSERVDLTQWAFRGQVRRLNDQRKETLLVYLRVGE